MRLATKTDRDRVVEILQRAYKDNPSFLWVIKKSSPKIFQKRLRWLCEFCFDIMQPIGGVYLTSLNGGVCMMYDNRNKKENIKTWWLQLKLAINVVGINRSLEIMQRESYIKKHRTKEDHLYIWIIAADPEIKGYQDMAEMRDETFALSKKLELPIYAETTVDRNVVMYQRYGFKEYHRWEVPGKNVTVYFMKREHYFVHERNLR